MTHAARLAAVIAEVERKLAEFYGFEPITSASAHLITREDLALTLGQQANSLPEFSGRAGVFMLEATKADELFIGVHFDQTITDKLSIENPMARLSDANLDEFCILVEEISHFHLLVNRAESGRGVSKLELEWQGEIDKLLVCAMMLELQYGNLHFLPLARRLYDQALITAPDHELYWQATRHAARFWFSIMRFSTRVSPELRKILRRAYDAPWAEKLSYLDTAMRFAQ